VPAPYIDPDLLQGPAWGAAFERGAAYFRQGAVARLTWDAASGTLSADVRGSRAGRYRTTVRLDPVRPTQIVWAHCTCPVAERCKHAVATILASNADAVGPRRPVGDGVGARPAPTHPRRAPAPGWRDLLPVPPASASRTVPLALGVELRRRVTRSSSWLPPRVERVTPATLVRGGRDLLLGVRPLQRSAATGTWIRGDVSWEALRRPGGPHDERQARWFAELHSIARDLRTLGAFADTSDWITLDTVQSTLLWGHLSAGADLGIPLVPAGKRDLVRLATDASVVVELARGDDGGLVLAPRVTIDGEETDVARVRPIGAGGLYAYDLDGPGVSVVLAPATLAEPLPALLAGAAPVQVPAAEAAEFLRDHYPRIARTGAVTAAAGVELPALDTPHLVVAVAHGRTRVDYRLAWDYPGLGRLPYDASSPDRDPAFERAARARLEAAWRDATDLPPVAAATLTDVEAAEFVTRVLPALSELAEVRVESTGTPRAFRELTAVPEITVSTVETADPDWFDLGIVVTIDGRRIPFGPLFAALSLGKRKLLLSDGGWFSLAHPALQELKDLIDEAAGLNEWEAGPRISRYQTAMWADFEDLADEALPAVSWRDAARGLRDVEGIEPTAVPAGLHATLRPYQKTGFDWLAFLWRHRLGGILADDMGLGKTVQMLAFLQHLRESGERRPVLVVAPTSVLDTWATEAARFTPELRVAVVAATGAKRGETVADAVGAADVVVTSYTLLRLDESEFGAVEWAVVVLDEAQFAKNPQTKLHRAAAGLRADATYAITGTPLENSLGELWALLALTAPGLFASARRFREEYIGPIEKGKVPENQEGGAFRAARLERLRRRIRPLVLRRTKELVAPELPARQEQELRIELGPAHRALYDAVLQRERQKVLGLLEDLDRNRFIVFRSLTLLRMLSLAPGLVDPEHADIPSSKLDALMEQLTEVVAEGHRVLVFSQFTSYLALVAARLERDGIDHATLDGSTRRRAEVIEAFRTGDAPVFLISLKAGGFGLTLTEADYVFLLDPWWNPAAEAQAVDRTHRIGQTRRVFVYRLIAADTIEDKVMALQRRKARLFQAVMDDDALFGQALSADDIRGLFEG